MARLRDQGRRCMDFERWWNLSNGIPKGLGYPAPVRNNHRFRRSILPYPVRGDFWGNMFRNRPF